MFAFIGKWQPKQLVAHDEWHTWQVMASLLCASLTWRSCVSAGTSPQVTPSRWSVLAYALRALYMLDVGSTVSTVCGTSQRLLGSMLEY